MYSANKEYSIVKSISLPIRKDYWLLLIKSEKKLQDVNTSLLCPTSLKKWQMTILFFLILKWLLLITTYTLEETK